jgi:GxxExxY protein
MNTDKTGYCNSLTERVLSAVFEVSNNQEKVYERALLLALTFRGIRATSQTSLAVTYKGHPVGEYFADILVEDLLAIEVKCVDRLAPPIPRNASTTCEPPPSAPVQPLPFE